MLNADYALVQRVNPTDPAQHVTQSRARPASIELSYVSVSRERDLEPLMPTALFPRWKSSSRHRSMVPSQHAAGINLTLLKCWYLASYFFSDVIVGPPYGTTTQ